LHVFLRIPTKAIRVAYPPEDMVQIRGGVLDDVNEVVIGDIGWVGSLPKMLIFHWCQRPLAQKEAEINAAYDAADSLASHGLPLSLALSVVHGAAKLSPWATVFKFRVIVDTYKKLEPVERTSCW
ncbi:unnamed protein product, partial [Polarella glacialis]